MRSLIEGIWTDEVFDAVRVDLDAPVGQEGLRSVPMAVELGPVFTEACFGRDAQALVLQPFPKRGDRRGGPGPACREALAGGRAADIFLDGIDFSDPAQALGGNLGAVAVEHFFQFAAGVGPAMRDRDRLGVMATS